MRTVVSIIQKWTRLIIIKKKKLWTIRNLKVFEKRVLPDMIKTNSLDQSNIRQSKWLINSMSQIENSNQNMFRLCNFSYLSISRTFLLFGGVVKK